MIVVKGNSFCEGYATSSAPAGHVPHVPLAVSGSPRTEGYVTSSVTRIGDRIAEARRGLLDRLADDR